ncbi:hypothetical protein [Telmatospirillum sp. J64-1]|uniref:hypothetical protein n=1 Tax=Telmatospirillum sp. J64-1 TaxID=2502183 RepID=UPI00115DCFA1|nr:hypothetical protein [Telmatospirillum sp. J64-1]
MAHPLEIAFDEMSGDGVFLRLLPGFLRRFGRSQALRLRRLREARILRVARNIYPSLQALEEATIPPEQRVLAGQDFEAVLRDHRAIERGLTLFEAAWQSGLTRIIPKAGTKPLAYNDKRSLLGACGMSLQAVEQYFLHRAMTHIFAENPKALEKLSKFAQDRTSLPRMRMLASMDSLAIDELQRGLGRRFAEIMSAKNEDYLAALRHFKAFHVRELRKLLLGDFALILDWQPDFITAVIDSFQCVEQFRDLGECFLDLKTPEMIRALGRWEKRDITDKINAQRVKAGKSKLKGRRFETDIGAMRKIMGMKFSTMFERDENIIDAFGQWARLIRQTEGQEKTDLIDQVQIFTKRYLGFTTWEMMDALTMINREGRECLSFVEANAILEGLWMKNGLGSAFFDGPFQTPQAADAVRGLVSDYFEMKHRGSIKGSTEITKIIVNSDLFDRRIVPLIRLKRAAQEAQEKV